MKNMTLVLEGRLAERIERIDAIASVDGPVSAVQAELDFFDDQVDISRRYETAPAARKRSHHIYDDEKTVID